MLRPAIGLSLIALCGFYLLTPSQAQDDSGSGSHKTFGSRLEQFRQELFGDDVRPTTTNSTKKASTNENPWSTPHNGNIMPPTVTRKPVPTAAAKPSESSTPVKPTPLFEPSTQQSSRRNQSGPTPAARETSSATASADQPTAGANRDKLVVQEELDSPNRKSVPTVAKHPREMSIDIDDELDQPIPSTPTPAPRMARNEQPLRKPVTRVERPTPAVDDEGDATVNKNPNEQVLTSSRSPMINVEATGPTKIAMGKEAVFTVKIRNTGDIAAKNAVVSVQIPAFVEIRGMQPTAGAVHAPEAGHGERHEWRMDRLEAHGRETLVLKLIPRKSLPIELAVNWTCLPESLQAVVEVQEPKLAMTLSGPNEVLYGQSKVYKLTLSNPGNGEAEKVTLALSPIGRGTEKAAKQHIGTLGPGETKSIEVELTAREAGELTIKATATAEGGLHAEASESVLVRRADLQVAVEAPKVKFAGTPGTFRVRVSNPGDATAEHVQISAALPAEAKFVSSSTGGKLSSDQRTVTWTLSTLPAGMEKQLDVKCVLLAAGENQMQVSTTADGDLTAASAAGTRVEALADLKLEIRDPQGPIPIGEDTVYEVVIRNRGTKAAEKVDLVVYFSEGMEATRAEGAAHEITPGQVMFQPLATLPAGSETVYKIHARADRAGNHVFRAEATCPPLAVKLAGEQTTRFYAEDSDEPTAGNAEVRSAKPLKEPAMLSPVPNDDSE